MQSGERIAINGRDYRLDAVLSTGAGSYGQVWAATDALGRAVAVKLINAEAMTQADPTLHGHWRAHLEREIAFLSGLDADQSRHVVALLDHGVVEGQPALVLERLQANLGQWLAQQRRDGAPAPDLGQVLDWAEQILDGLDVVHQAGFVYRDLKFSNLLVGDGGARLKLADFGSLKREDGDNTRSFVGTPATMAPEQVLPACQGVAGCEYAVDYRADYYALGLLLFSLLADQPTTAAQRRLGQLLALHGQEGVSQRDAQLGGLDDAEREQLRCAIEFWTVPARPEADGGIAALLASLIERLLAREPAHRPTDSLEIRAVLDTARVHPATALTLTPDWSAPPPAAEPPNWHPRRMDRPPPRSWPRWALLAGGLGLAGAMAWALVGPVRPIDRDQAETLSTVIAPPAARIAPVAESAAPSVPAPAVVESAPAPSAPVADDAEPADRAPPASTESLPIAQPTPEAEPAVVVAPPPAPPVVEPRPSARAKPADKVKPGKSTVAADRPARVDRSRTARPPARTRPAEAERPAPAAADRIAKPAPPPTAPVAVERATPAPAARIAKPAPPPPAPVAVERATPAAAARIAKPAPVVVEPPRRPRETRTVAVTRASSASSMVARPPATAKPAAKPVERVARVEPASRPTARAASTSTLPPIQLEARPEPAPALPPIRLEARPQPAPPPIELVSRSSAASSSPPPVKARAESRSKPPANSTPRPARAADPITQFRDDASRTATAVGDWVSRTSTTVSQEVRRGLETADRTVGRWTGSCNQPDGCGRNTTQVERRDHGSSRSGGTASSREPPAVRNQDGYGFAPPPPRAYRD